jgi:hypothetical protein
MSGWFGFETPNDLLLKLERELAKLNQDPSDGDTAFNLFVTGWSLIDWCNPNDRKAREALCSKHPVLQVCAHLADGSKHLRLTNPKRNSVRGISRGGNWASRPIRLSPGKLPVSNGHFVHLEGDAAKAFGEFPSALDLAKELVAWLKDYIT